MSAKLVDYSQLAFDDVADDDRRVLLTQIAGLIARAKQLDLPDTVFLLNMVYLDLQTKIHDINDKELQAFSRAVLTAIEPP